VTLAGEDEEALAAEVDGVDAEMNEHCSALPSMTTNAGRRAPVQRSAPPPPWHPRAVDGQTRADQARRENWIERYDGAAERSRDD
jgi:hypothetical protein